MSKYRALTEEELGQLEHALGHAARRIGGSGTLTIAQVQACYDALLQDGEVEGETVDLLGLAFGELLRSVGWLSWQMLEDPEYGDVLSLVADGLSLSCSPLSMIANRLEDGEEWDLAELRDSTLRKLRQLGQESDVRLSAA